MTIGDDIFKGSDFGLSVEYVGDEHVFDEDWDRKGYEVYLPHQCDRWEVAYDGSSKEEATDRLRSLIREAEAAIEVIEGHEGSE